MLAHLALEQPELLHAVFRLVRLSRCVGGHQYLSDAFSLPERLTLELLLNEDHAFPLLHKLYLLGLSGCQCAGRAQRALAGEGVLLLRLKVFI